jgi:hypothetical protein
MILLGGRGEKQNYGLDVCMCDGCAGKSQKMMEKPKIHFKSRRTESKKGINEHTENEVKKNLENLYWTRSFLYNKC